MKKILFVSVLLVAIMSTSFAFNYSPSFEGMIGGTFLHGTSSHLQTIQGKNAPYFRTSFYLNADFFPADFSFRRFSVGAGITAQYTGESLRAGNSVIQAYSGFGPVLKGVYFFSDRFNLGLKTRLMFNKNVMKYRFDTFDVEILPILKLKNSGYFHISFISPVTFTYRNDSISVRLGVGVSVQLIVGSRDGAAAETERRKEKESVYDAVLSGGAR